MSSTSSTCWPGWHAEPAPESAATALRVATPPLANTERYYSLRTGSAANTATEEADHA